MTQVAEVVRAIKDSKLAFATERVVELPNNGGVRNWDVRLAKVRGEAAAAEDGAEAGEEGTTDNWKMVCRPKVGGMIVGGGFFAMFRRLDIVRREEGDTARKSTQQQKAETGGDGIRGWIRRHLGF